MKFLKCLPLALVLLFVGCAKAPSEQGEVVATIDVLKDNNVINTVTNSCDLRFEWCGLATYSNARKIDVANSTYYFCDLNENLFIIQSEYKGGSVSHAQAGFKCDFEIKKLLK